MLIINSSQFFIPVVTDGIRSLSIPTMAISQKILFTVDQRGFKSAFPRCPGASIFGVNVTNFSFFQLFFFSMLSVQE